jgi:hypothetical protein
VDPYDELLEEPLLLDGVAIRRWSAPARVPRPGDTAEDCAKGWTARSPSR